eukprot:gene31007-38321_t
MVFLAVVAGYGIVTAEEIHSVSMMFVAVYLLIFALFVFLHDMSLVCKMDGMFKSHFPFLDLAMGKRLFLIFIGALTFGLTSPRDLVVAAGSATIAWGGLQCVLHMVQPAYFQLP